MLHQKLAEANPGVSLYQRSLGCNFTNTADCLLALGRLDEARAGYKKGLVIHEAILKATPKARNFKRDLAYTLNHIAQVQAPAEAAASVRRARGLYLSLEPLASTEWAELAASHALLAGLAGKEGSGVTSDEGRAEAVAAVEALRKAVADGYRDRQAINNDPMFAALRQRDDFQRLIKDLEPKSQTKDR